MNERSEALKKWARDPNSVKPKVIAAALLESTFERRFFRLARSAPAPVIREVLACIERAPEKSDAGVFLAELMRTLPIAELVERWAKAVDSLEKLQGVTVPVRDKIQDPHFLQAAQAVAVNRPSVFGSALALLAADGSVASIEALMPTVVLAQQAGGHELRRLERALSRSGSTPEMKAMVESVRQRLKQTNAASPALRLSGLLGIEVERLVMSVFFYSSNFNAPTKAKPREYRAQGQLHLESSSPDWLTVHIDADRGDSDDGKTTSFYANEVFCDELRLGRCELEELPAYLARVQRRLHIKWDDAPEVSGSLRGKKREKFREWLFAPSARS